jgi:Glycoside Hydrolase Family 113
VHRGVSVGLWPSGATDDPARIADATTRLDEIAADGATDVALVVAWRQHDVHAIALAPGTGTASDEVVRAAIRAARARGLAVLLFPIVELDELGPGTWRGTLAPRDPGAWWSAYEKFITHYAQLAADEDAEALSIGSELGSTEAWRDRWFHLASRIERIYDGALTYSANWDHFAQVSFAARLDWLGVTGYFELTTDHDAGEDALAAAWAAPRDALLAWAAKAGKPLVITEVGWPSVDGGAVHPWDYTGDGAVDLEEQRRAYRAFARAWGGRGLAGVFLWEWSGPGGARDRGYTPRDKPAECVLADWFDSP